MATRKTYPISAMEALTQTGRAVILTTGFNQQIALVQKSGRFFVYQRMLENFVLI
jgi:protein-L-isoaspartate O-methyltransferase